MVQRPQRPLLLGRSMWKHAEDGDHVLPALLHPRRFIRVGIHAANDRYWSLPPRENAEEGGVTVVQSRYGGGVSANKYSGTSQCWPEGSGANSAPTPWGCSDLSSFLPSGIHAPLVPSDRITGGGDQQDQPPGSLFAPPCAICHCDPRGGKSALPPLPSMWYVHFHTSIEWQESRHWYL